MGYSQIATCAPGTLVFISGQVAWQPGEPDVPNSLEEQARVAMGNVVRALDAVGASVENVTSMRMYVVNPTPEDFYAPAPVLREFFGDVLPTFTAVGVTALGGEGLRIELEATAVV